MEGPPPSYNAPPTVAAPQPGNQQQQQQQTSVVVVNQPRAANTGIVAQPQNIRDWSSGICGCFEDCSSCCFAYWCYPCFLCALTSKMDENCCGAFCCGLLLPAYPNTFVVAMRTKLRTQYGIKGECCGGICGDMCCLCWCPLCTTTQMWRELKHFGRI